MSWLDQMQQWYYCGRQAGIVKSRVCIGPFATATEADQATTTMTDTTLLPVCIVNPFREATLVWRYNRLFMTDVSKINIVDPRSVR